MRLPEFAQCIHYRELRGGSWRFETLCALTVEIPALRDSTKSISFRDQRGREWAWINRGQLVIRRGYRWNGCSPKWWVPLVGWVGTPDWEPTRLASLVHDICFQFLRTEHFPLTIHECNELFYDIMAARNFRLSNTYRGAVRDFGERYAGRYPKAGERSVLLFS